MKELLEQLSPHVDVETKYSIGMAPIPFPDDVLEVLAYYNPISFDPNSPMSISESDMPWARFLFKSRTSEATWIFMWDGGGYMEAFDSNQLKEFIKTIITYEKNKRAKSHSTS